MSRISRPLRVLYLVPDLGVGGAERHVTTLMPALDPDRFEPSVICIGDEGVLFGALVDGERAGDRAASDQAPGVCGDP